MFWASDADDRRPGTRQGCWIIDTLGIVMVTLLLLPSLQFQPVIESLVDDA